MKTILLFFLSMAAVFAADPAQPTVGKTPVINATNGFGGNLTVRTQLNVGYPGQAGLIQILSTNGTFTGTLSLNDQGTFVLTDDVTDGASAVAFSFNSSNVLSTPGAKLATFGNAGTNVGFQHFNGGLDIGRNVKGTWNPDFSDMFVAVWDGDTGESQEGFLFLDVHDSMTSPTNFMQGGFNLQNDAGGSGAMYISSFRGFSNETATVEVNPESSGQSGYNFVKNNITLTGLLPTVADGSTPCKLDTSLAHTSGNLMEVKNMGTNAFTVSAVSGYTGSGTLFLSDDGTYKSAGGGATINPTDGYLPYRSNATVFGDSPFYRINTTSVGFNATNKFINKPNSTSLGVGTDALNKVSTGGNNVAIGNATLNKVTTGGYNQAVGYNALGSLVDGEDNVAIGDSALVLAVSSLDDVAIGFAALSNATSDDSVGIGYQAGSSLTSGFQDVYIGANATASAGAAVNEIAIGYDAIGNGTNTITLGNSSTKDIYFPATIHFDHNTTNILARSGADLVYTNSGTVPKFYVKDSSARSIALGLAGSGLGVVTTSGGKLWLDGKTGPNNTNPRSSLDVIGALAYTVTPTAITGDDTTIGAGDVSLILINSDNNTPANRTLHLNNNGIAGQSLEIVVLSNAAQLLNNDPISGGTGSLKLANDWNATTWSSIDLRCDGTNWIETARSVK